MVPELTFKVDTKAVPVALPMPIWALATTGLVLLPLRVRVPPKRLYATFQALLLILAPALLPGVIACVPLVRLITALP